MTVRYDEKDIRKVSAIVIGPPGTPYQLGFYEVSFAIAPTVYRNTKADREP
jgi:ubiquitin-conjugating enzyme E2 Z